jgi:hypothetical protein
MITGSTAYVVRFWYRNRHGVRTPMTQFVYVRDNDPVPVGEEWLQYVKVTRGRQWIGQKEFIRAELARANA